MPQKARKSKKVRMLRLTDCDEKFIARLRQRQEDAAGRSREIGFRARQDDAEPEILLYGDIGFGGFGGLDGITLADFADELKALDDEPRITVRINSPGGDVFDGITMYNRLVAAQPRIRIMIEWIAASIAAVIAMAGDEILIAENGMMMIHDAFGLEIGNSEDMRAMADILDDLDTKIARTFAARTGQTDAAIRKLMDAETRFKGPAAVEAGLADRLIPAKTAPAAP